MAISIDFAPFIPLAALWAAIAVSALLTIYGFVRGARGAWARALAFAAAIFVLAHPLIVRETREPLNDIAAIVIDRSQSMGVGSRTADASRALAEVKKQLGRKRTSTFARPA